MSAGRYFCVNCRLGGDDDDDRRFVDVFGDVIYVGFGISGFFISKVFIKILYDIIIVIG